MFMEVFAIYNCPCFMIWPKSSCLNMIIELDDGKIYRKALYLMVKTMVSCKFPLNQSSDMKVRLRQVSSNGIWICGWWSYAKARDQLGSWIGNPSGGNEWHGSREEETGPAKGRHGCRPHREALTAKASQIVQRSGRVTLAYENIWSER